MQRKFEIFFRPKDIEAATGTKRELFRTVKKLETEVRIAPVASRTLFIVRNHLSERT
ncbi:hypothetical protein [Novibacillus thermophilus]|uniref:hypothetical protein n=1 Tax=Novibacillus thermophilus TaxID=1471761 RepID=UPI00147372BB|nr:hypothetical protein [Novibacillus thermophilus]